MSVDGRNCGECGASDWSKIVETDYPERRQERARTVQTVYKCQECGAEGKHFDQQNSGTVQFSGALR